MDLMLLILAAIIGSLLTMIKGSEAPAKTESLAASQFKSDFTVMELPFCGPAIRPQKCFMYYQEVLNLCR